MTSEFLFKLLFLMAGGLNFTYFQYHDKSNSIAITPSPRV